MINESPVPKRLRALRKEHGLSQMALGVSIGIEEASTSARISQYETGKHTVDYQTLRKIADFFKVSVAYFYATDDNLAQIIRLSGLR